MKHVVMFSSGAGSWMAAKRVAAEHGTSRMVLLFADTLIEDEDNYRFLGEAAENVGAPLVTVADGRTPWEVFRDVRYIGNSRIAQCSRLLKQKVCDDWLDANCDPSDTMTYLGIDWTEEHRVAGVEKRYRERAEKAGVEPFRVSAPLCSPPYLEKRDVLQAMKNDGLAPPRLYAMGFPHANCGGFCVRAGQAQFELLHRVLPERYRHHEEQEIEWQVDIRKNHTILRDRRGGESRPMTLREFREKRIETGQADLFEWGGCGCF